MGKLKIGDKAPAFTLLNQDGKEVSLTDFKSSVVVLYFYPRAMTPGCTTQACGIRDSLSLFKKKKIVTLAVSPDSVEKLKRFEEKQDLNFNLLADPELKVIKEFGAWGKKKFMGKEFMGVLRQTFIIDQKRNICHIMEKVNTKTHHDDVYEWIAENL